MPAQSIGEEPLMIWTAELSPKNAQVHKEGVLGMGELGKAEEYGSFVTNSPCNLRLIVASPFSKRKRYSVPFLYSSIAYDLSICLSI